MIERLKVRLDRLGLAVALIGAAFCAGAEGVKWEPDFRFPGTFFPSFAISAAGLDSHGVRDTPTLYGYQSGSFGVRVLEAPAGARLRVQVEMPELGVSGELETQAGSDGKSKLLVPRLSWNQAKLAQISQPLSTDVIFRLFVDGVAAGEERRPVRVRATTDAPLRACRAPTQCSDYSPYLAAFVNENHPGIDGILRAALDIPAMPVKAWTGTQGSPEDVIRQVWAIWYLFQRSKVTYSSITTVSDTRADLLSQTVRPLSLAMRTSQANCIDGTVVFASVLRKIGIEPIIVLVPGHAFLGFYTDANRTQKVFLETTMLNDANNPFHQRGPTGLGTSLAKSLGMDTHIGQSQQSFKAALAEGQRKFEMAVRGFEAKQPGYMFIPVVKAREVGILPLPL